MKDGYFKIIFYQPKNLVNQLSKLLYLPLNFLGKIMLVLKIFIGAVVTALLAFVIVKYLSLKFRSLVAVVLLAVSGYLSYLIFKSIMAPIKFNDQKKVRYAKVIEKLKMIRDAEDAHKAVRGDFQKDPADLINFVETGQFAITTTRNEVVKVNKGTKWQPIMVEIEKRVTDTIGYESVKDRLFAGRNYQNMFALEGTDIKFNVEVSKIEKMPGFYAPVFEVKVDKGIILEGLDKNLIRQEKEAIGGDEVRGAFISVGSLEEVSSNGNWPPFYDQKNKK